MNEDDRMRLVQRFTQELPFGRALGLVMEEIGAGASVMRMPWNPDAVGDPETGVIHGGAVSALMDTCCGAAVFSHPKQPTRTATMDLRIDYMRAARTGRDIVARAECYHMTRSVAFVRAVAEDGEADPVASATAAFIVERQP